MKKIILLQGIPASGKTSWARKFIKNNSENWIIINRDSIREMLGNYYCPTREPLVTKIETFCLEEGLSRNYNVIIDATNLNTRTVNNFENIAKRNDALIEYKFFEVKKYTAYWRDFKRGFFGRKVGFKVINKFYNKYIK